MERARSNAAHTWSEYIRLPEDDRRELIDGALVEVDVPKKWHERIAAELVWYLQSWARSRKRIVLTSGYKLRIGPRVGAMPDIQMLTEATYRAADEDGLADGHPELVVEVVLPRSRAHDRVRKARWYAAIGVPEYWIVDPRQRTLDRLVLKDGAVRRRTDLRGRDDLPSAWDARPVDPAGRALEGRAGRDAHEAPLIAQILSENRLARAGTNDRRASVRSPRGRALVSHSSARRA